MNTFKFVILGGGTSGWLSALFLRHVLPESQITLVQNKQIGIVGVGEASTPTLVEFLSALKINTFDILNQTNGVIKNGILFQNWNGDQKDYFHGFQERINNFAIRNKFDHGCYDFYIKNVLSKGHDLSEYLYSPLLSKFNKVDLQHSAYSLHFDSNLLADFLESVGRQRNIQVIDGTYQSADIDENGNILAINLKEQIRLDCDFVFDCSGFHRLIIGQHFKEEWISYKKHLPMKKAIPFWLEKQDDIEPFTRAIAMKNGWCWHIPLQHRVGAGYVFDSDYINEEQALEEAEVYFGRKLKINRVIDFDAGRYKNVWVKNCMAVGLSSSFIEPLESTALFAVIVQLKLFLHYLNEIKNPNSKSIEIYNRIIAENMDHVLEFVYLHYYTKRSDSNFWKDFKNNYPMPNGLDYKLDLLKTGNLRHIDLVNNKKTLHFELQSYLQVANGLQLIKSANIEEYQDIMPTVDQYKITLDDFVERSLSMSQLAQLIKLEAQL